METSQALLFFFSALGAFNGLLFGAYFLLLAKPRTLSRQLFGAFILMISIRVGKSVFLYFNRELAREYLQLGLTACLFIGPMLYFFVRSVETETSRTLRRELWVTIGILLGIALIGGTLFPYRAHPQAWQVIVKGIYFVWFAYTVAAIWVGRHHFRKVRAKVPLALIDRTIILTTLGSLVLVLIYNFSNFTSYIAGALAFSILLYASWAATAIFRATPREEVPEESDDKSRTPLLSPELETTLRDRLESVMRNERLYVNPNLKLAELATAIGCTPHQLSDLLNNSIGESFHHYLNRKRVELAQDLIRSETHLTLEAIGLSCGFNARSTFYKAFKKSTGMTPASFRDEVCTKA